jgi:hypothetical protein
MEDVHRVYFEAAPEFFCSVIMLFFSRLQVQLSGFHGQQVCGAGPSNPHIWGQIQKVDRMGFFRRGDLLLHLLWM